MQYHQHLPTLPQPAQHLPIRFLSFFFTNISGHRCMGTDWLETEWGPNEDEFLKLMLRTFSKWVRSGKEKLISRSAPLLKLVQQTNEQMTDRKAVYISFHEKSRLCILQLSRPTQRSRRICKNSVLHLFLHLRSKLLTPDNLIYIYFLSMLDFFSSCLNPFPPVLILRHSRVPVLFLIAFADKRTYAHNTIVKK